LTNADWWAKVRGERDATTSPTEPRTSAMLRTSELPATAVGQWRLWGRCWRRVCDGRHRGKPCGL